MTRILKSKKYLIFVDFEGTQFSHEIIASGLIKTRVEENGDIVPLDDGLLTYSKSRCPIGKIVTSLTGINEDFIKANGHPFEETIKEFEFYLQDINLDEALFVCFGSNDILMLNESNRYSNPSNKEVVVNYIHHFFDFLPFLSNYIKDDKGNTLSLVNYLKIYNLNPSGNSHNPLNDAIDLMNLFIAFKNDEEILFTEYCKSLKHAKYPNNAIKKVITQLINNESIDREEFLKEIKESLN